MGSASGPATVADFTGLMRSPGQAESTHADPNRLRDRLRGADALGDADDARAAAGARTFGATGRVDGGRAGRPGRGVPRQLRQRLPTDQRAARTALPPR